MTVTDLTRCVVFDVDGTLAEFDAQRFGQLVHGVEKHWDGFHAVMARVPLIEPVPKLLRRLKKVVRRL